MHLPPSDRLQGLIQDAAPARDYVASLVRYTPASLGNLPFGNFSATAALITASGTAVINPKAGQQAGLSLNVSATLAQKPALLVPGALVHVRRIGNYPPLITEVISAPLPTATMTIPNTQFTQGLTFGSAARDTFTVECADWGTELVVLLSLYAQDGSPVVLPNSIQSAFFVQLNEGEGLSFGRATFGGFLRGIDRAKVGIMTLRGFGRDTAQEVSISAAALAGIISGVEEAVHR